MKKRINILFFLIVFFLTFITLLNLNQSSNELSNHLSGKAKKIKTSSGALESMQFMSMVRAFPDNDIPADKFFKAFEYTRDNMQEFDAGDSPTQWSSIGPNNIGGRSLSLAFHPQDTATLFIGSASGGLWKSTTGGLGANAWTRIETGYPSLAVSWIAIDSVNPNIMYIGTGENYGYQFSANGLNIRVTRGMYGIGILKTTNGGASWFKSLDWSYQNQRGVWRVMFNPKNRNVLYAATSEGLWKTNNAGSNWFQILNYQMVMDLEINHVDTSVVYISVGNLSNDVPNPNVGIYKSTNSGGSWTKLAGGLPSFWSGKATIELYKGNPNFVYASIANDITGYVGYYTSTNAGSSWTFKTSSLGMSPQGWYNNGHIVKPDDPNTVLVGTIDVNKSVNGGSSFSLKSNWSLWNEGPTPPGEPESFSQQYAHADHHEFFVNPRDANKLYCITDGGLYRSNNFGETYYACNGGYVTSQFYGGFVNSYQDSIWCLGGMQDNRSAFYQGTVAWYKTFVGDGLWCGVNSQNHNTCYTEYTYGSIYRSNNGGMSFNSISSGIGAGNQNNYCFAAPYIVCKSNPSILFIGGTSIYKSSVGGGSWQNLGSVGAKTISMGGSATSTDTVYAGVVPVSSGQPASIFRTTTGSTFTNVSGSQLPSRYPIDLHVNPGNSRDVYVVLGGFGSGHVYRSTNAGLNWSNISGNLPDVPHQSVVIDPLYPQNIYVGNDLGVYVTVNGGTTWFEYRTGMPYALVFDLTIVYPNRHIRATTHGNGIWERSLVQNPVGLVHNQGNTPSSYRLYQNYPNPFNPVTTIKFDLPKSSNVIIKVYDIMGREVLTMVNEKLNAGSYSMKWDASVYSSGIYFYRLESEGFSQTNKMILVK
jgi:hypothetical protein